MKKILLITFCLFAYSISYSQTKVNIEFINETKVLLNEIEINRSTSFSDIKELLGEPVVYKEYPTGKINYHYNDDRS